MLRFFSFERVGFAKRLVCLTLICATVSAQAHPHLWIHYVPQFTFENAALTHIDLYLGYTGMPPMSFDPIPPEDVYEVYLMDYPYIARLFIQSKEVTNLTHEIREDIVQPNGTWQHVRLSFSPQPINEKATIRFSLQSGDTQDPGYCQTLVTGTNLFATGTDVAIQSTSMSLYGLSFTVAPSTGTVLTPPPVFMQTVEE